MLKKIQETANWINDKISIKPEVGIVLGTGLGGLIDEIDILHTINYETIPNFPVSTIKGHQGRLIFGYLGGKSVVAMQGRFHFYEGYTMQEVTLPIRIMKLLGVKLLVLSNASGGVNPDYSIGDMMFITDHINLIGENPLNSYVDEGLGDRFVDMSRPYEPEIIEKAVELAENMNISFQKGVYAAVSGPNYETPAEYNYIRIIGADAVGMSTVPEVIVARQMDMRCFAVSVISDLGVSGKIVKITHEEVIDAASLVEPLMTKLIRELLKTL
jgi:purine-nucleoside phosphorylase